MARKETLASRLYQTTVSCIGSDEHAQIAGLLKDCQVVVVDQTTAEMARDQFYLHPWQFECHLDVIRIPDQPIWYEWPLPMKSGHGSLGSATTGCLLTPHPHMDGVMVVVTGWQSGLQARHSYAVAIIDTHALSNLAYEARTGRSSDDHDSMSRIMAAIGVTLPPGFAEEIDIISDGEVGAAEAAMRDATSEMPLLLSLLVLREATGGLQIEEHGDLAALKPSDHAPKPWGKRMLEKLIGRKGMFSRIARNGDVSIRWHGPTATTS